MTPTMATSTHTHHSRQPSHHRQAGNKYSSVSVGVLALSLCLIATGCSDADKPSSDSELSKKADSAVEVGETKKTNTTNDSKSNKTQAPTSNTTQATTSTLEDNQPVSYNVSNWQTDSVAEFDIDDLKKMQKIFGKVTMTDENSLDYASNTAIKYRFMQGDKPYLDIIDSPEYLEFGWYYANPSDSKEEKEMSISHAKKAHQVAQGLMGEAGASLVASMLENQITKDKEVGGQSVALAKCEFYSCMLILKKS